MPKPIARAKPALRLIDCEQQRAKADQQETIECLWGLLSSAEEGQLPHGFVVHFVDGNGQRQIARTGRYERDAGVLSLAGFHIQSVASNHSGSTE